MSASTRIIPRWRLATVIAPTVPDQLGMKMGLVTKPSLPECKGIRETDNKNADAPSRAKHESGEGESEFTFKLEKYIRIGIIYIEREPRRGPINIVSCHEIVLENHPARPG